jgi:phage gp36-like protein
MAYIVQADLTEVLSQVTLLQLTDDEKNGTQVAARVTSAITSSEGVINGYLGVRYIVPVAGIVPPLIKKWDIDIANYFLHQRRRVPDDVWRAYEDAIARLRDVAAGKMTLGIEPTPATSLPLGGVGAVYGPPRVFTRGTLASY